MRRLGASGDFVIQSPGPLAPSAGRRIVNSVPSLRGVMSQPGRRMAPADGWLRPPDTARTTACQRISVAQGTGGDWSKRRANKPRRPWRPDGAQALSAAAWLVSSDAANGGARPASSRDAATAARIARIAAGSSTVPIKRKRPPQREHATTSISNARLIRSAHAQCRESGAAAELSFPFAAALAPTGASTQDLDTTKPAGSVKIRVETITHYLEKYAGAIIEKKKAAMPPGCPLLPAA